MRLLGTTAVAALLLSPIGAGGQSLLDRPPNISGDWVGAPGTIYFNFVHRFTSSDAPERKVSNVPTFLIAAGLPGRLLAGFNYSTNSTLAPNFPNEWEIFGRWAPISEDYGAPLDLGAEVGYNNAAEGIAGELSAAKMFGPIRIILAGRALTDPIKSGARFAFAGGTTIRLGQYVALAGDVGALTKRDTSEKVAWSAGLHFAIPLTPHTFSLQVTNVAVASLQGESRGGSVTRYGFEFTIPLTLSRYFGSRAHPSPDSAPQPVALVVPPAASPDTVRPQAVVTAPPQPLPDTTTPRVIHGAPPTAQPAAPLGGTPPRAVAAKPVARIVRTGMKNIHYLQPTMEIEVGTTVEWKNNDPLLHSVTAVNKSFDSGVIQPGKTYRHTFTRAGTFDFYCVPHPFMKGTIVVKQP
jgi:plastocyanin